MTGDSATQATAKELPDIQGGLFGFNKDLQTFVYVNFPDASTGRTFLGQMHGLLSGGDLVLDFNRAFKAAKGKPAYVLKSTWTNIWLTIDGLRTVEAPDLDSLPEDFRQGMAQRAGSIGDVGASEPAQWVAPFAGGTPPHCIVVVAADTQEDLQLGLADVEGAITTAGVTSADVQAGAALPTGTEHFGFRDGISQPGILGLTSPSRAPHERIAAGEFLIGYEDEQGQVSGQPAKRPPPPPSYDPASPPVQAIPLPDWCRNGSFVVYRRLRQDVAGFRAVDAQAADAGLSVPQLQAKLVGRWPTGAPMEHVPGMPHGIDPSAIDVSATDGHVLDDRHINNFDYAVDADGMAVPRAAHIRKANPRSAALPGGDDSRRHRLIRRGVAYGPPFQPGEPAYDAAVPVDQDRGLLFVSYQASIADGFEFVQRVWANASNFPLDGDGSDPIINQDVDPRPFRLPSSAGPKNLTFAQWVRTTGGGYFFAPSVSAVARLSEAPVAAKT